MQFVQHSAPQRSSKAIMAALRAGLVGAARQPGASRSPMQVPAFTPLSNPEILTLAQAWRLRVDEGDHGADAVALALESVVHARNNPPSRNPLRVVVNRLSDLMQLS